MQHINNVYDRTAQWTTYMTTPHRMMNNSFQTYQLFRECKESRHANILMIDNKKSNSITTNNSNKEEEKMHPIYNQPLEDELNEDENMRNYTHYTISRRLFSFTWRWWFS